jgi:hypothetical protein
MQIAIPARAFPDLPAISRVFAFRIKLRNENIEGTYRRRRTIMSFAGYHPDIDPAYLAPDDWHNSVEFIAAQGAAAVNATSPDLDVDQKQPPMKPTDQERQRADAHAHVRSEIEQSPSSDHLNIGATRGIQSDDGRRPQKLDYAKPPYIKHVVGANGRQRSYYCRGGRPFIRLSGEPGSPEFRASYIEAVQTKAMLYRLAQRPPMPARSFNNLVERYFQSASFQKLLPPTQKVYHRVIARMMRCDNLSARRVVDLSPTTLRRILAMRRHTPAAANDMLKKLRILMRFAIELKWRPDDPTRPIKPLDATDAATGSRVGLRPQARSQV